MGAFKAKLGHQNERLARFTENDLQALKEQILAIPLKDPTDANAVPEFVKAMEDLFYNNHVVQGSAQESGDPRNIEYMG